MLLFVWVGRVLVVGVFVCLLCFGVGFLFGFVFLFVF